MTIRDVDTSQESAARQFRSAGLGARSSAEAARLLFETGMPFESAAVLGQRIDEASTATLTSIAEAARRWSRIQKGPRTTTAWGREIKESPPPPKPSAAPGRGVFREAVVIDGKPHERITEYTPVDESTPPRTHNAWGRPVSEQNEEA